jgi:S-DNA-T family DNA segregation ATPase FtsK/SpoIIIE
MSKRGRRKKLKLNIKSETLKSIGAVMLILIGLLIVWSYIAPTYNLTSVIYQNLKKLLGFSMYILPFSLISTGVIILWPVNFKLLNLRIVIGSYIFLFLVSSILSAFDKTLGGSVGKNIFFFLETNVGYIGSLIGLFLLFISNLIFVSDIPGPMLQEIVDRVRVKFQSNPSGKATEVEESEIIEDLESEERNFETSNVKPTTVFTKLSSFAEPVAGSETLNPNVVNLNSKNITSSSKEIFPGSRDRIWEYPPITLLEENGELIFDSGNVKDNSAKIEETLRKFNINSKVVEVCPGPTVTQYALEVESQSKISNILTLGTDLMFALASPGELRIQVPIPGRSLVGIEVPNKNRSKVGIKTLFLGEKMKKAKDKLTIALGLDVAGKDMVYSIAKMPHLLVAGETGSGKSVFLHSIIFSILFKNSPDECKLVIFDPKTNEFHFYSEIPHLITPVVTDMTKVPAILEWAATEMRRRYKMFKDAQARNIDDYNERSGFQALPNIVIIADELAQLLMNDPAKSLKALQELTQLSRAAGIHLVLATQRPDTKIITGNIKANIPARIAFSVGSQVDSRVVLDGPGAERLLKNGDMLFSAPDTSRFERIQGAWVTNAEIGRLVDFICGQGIKPEFNEEVVKAVPKKDSLSGVDSESSDSNYEAAKEIAISQQTISASLLQRRLSIGFSRAGKLLDMLEKNGVIGPAVGSKPREVLISYQADTTILPEGSSDELNRETSEETSEVSPA